jgi:Holliday junction resolvasome RuvABC endonuclease subunit
MTVIAGIDYSFNSPSVCIHDGNVWSVNNCTFYYLTQKNKFLIHTDQVRGTLYEDFQTQQQRFDNLSNWAMKNMLSHGATAIGLEGYSYGSTGSRLFEIGENTGLLKYKMWKASLDFEVYAPTSVKKFACGKGNANKERLWEAFLEETGLNLFHLIGQEVGKVWNPVSDMVDAYFMAKYRFHNEKTLDIHSLMI